MDDFVARQHSHMKSKIADYRRGMLGLNQLIQQLEALAHVVGESFWADQVFPLVFDLERINSELVDKRRDVTPDEQEKIEVALKSIETLIAQ